MKHKFCYFLLFALCIFNFTSKAQTVALDYYFNHETHKNSKGESERFHYLWTEKANSGYSILGDIFKSHGFTLNTLETAPTAVNLKSADVYIIVDPDSRKENPAPNYIELADITQITTWVKKGGVLVMFANDSANVELPHFNQLAAAFGMHFNNDMQNHVRDDAHFSDGGITTIGNPFFKTAKKIFMKDVCSISTTGNAKSLLKNSDGATVIATSKYGKGSVIAISDPWLYDEYTNGRLPSEYENDKAAHDLVTWLKQQIKK